MTDEIIEQCRNINIRDLILSYGAEETKNRKLFKCFNKSFHKEGDKHPSLVIDLNKNICSCQACGLSGDPIALTKKYFNVDFKEAIKRLCDIDNITYNEPTKQTIINYIEYDKSIAYKNIKVADYIYKNLTKQQSLQIVYTFIYRFSLRTHQEPKEKFYKSRKIEHFNDIGFLSAHDIKVLYRSLIKSFDIDLLAEFKILSDDKSRFRYLGEFAVVPCFNLYNDLCNGLTLRSIYKTKVKEFHLNRNDLVVSIPYRSKNFFENEVVFITEGHIDALSLEDKDFISLNGVNGLRNDYVMLFKDKKVLLALDNDEAGRNGTQTIIEKLKGIAKDIWVVSWDDKIKDLNELRQCCKLDKSVLSFFKI